MAGVEHPAFGLGDHQPQRQMAFHRGQLLPDPGRCRRPAINAERHIGTQLRRQRPQPFTAQAQPVQPVHPAQVGRRVGAAAAQSRLGGDILFQRHGNPAKVRELPPQQPGPPG